MRITTLIPAAVIGFALGLGIAYLNRQSGKSERLPEPAVSKQNGANPGLSAMPSATDRAARLERIDPANIWVDVPEDILEKRIDRWKHFASPRGFSPMLARAVGISEQETPKVSAALVRAAEQFREADLEFHEFARTENGAIVTVPAYPERGREISNSLRAKIEAVAPAEGAEVVMRIMKYSFARSTGDLGTRQREIRSELGKDDVVSYSTKGDWRGSGGNVIPLDWQHFAPIFEPPEE